MRKIFGLFVFIVLLSTFVYIPVHKASAASYNPSDIIDNGIFDNSNSMSAAQINSFLNSFSGSCISPNSGFGAIDPIGYSPSNGYSFGGWTSAGQVIYDAANAYGLNPQVLIATLQKEQGLIVGGGSICGSNDQNQYAAAVGYDCPDSGTKYSYFGVNLYERNGVMVTQTNPTCVDSAAAAGFSQQLIRAAWLLKFGEQRSQGNINWAVIKGSWNNSNDPATCYYGPMTQGTFQICPNTSATYYDGYTTIDGTSVHINNGATAALYWYTPHLSGGQSFNTLFTSWFGSTTYYQPVDSMLVSGNQSGKLYFISLDNNTYYYIPTWSTAQAYGLDHYQIMPLNDSQIDSYSNGGTLKTLVFNNDDQKVYLVDGGSKYWFQQYCSQWGLDCLNNTPGDVTFMSSKYFDTIVNYKGNSQPILQYFGTYYLMNNGVKQPYANIANMQAAGYSLTNVINLYQGDLNAQQTLGSLQITIPTFIGFAPDPRLLYFDGTNYHYVPNYDTYISWGEPSILTPPVSTLNTTPPTLSASNLSAWVQDGSNYYYLDSGNKIDITLNHSSWTSGQFINLPDVAVSSYRTVSSQPFINISNNIYAVQGGVIRHVPTYDDYVWLGINSSNTMILGNEAYSSLVLGPDILHDGVFFTVTNNPGLYITNGTASYHVPSLAIAGDYGIAWNNVRNNLNPNVLSQGYPSNSDLSRWIVPSSGVVSYVANKNLISVGSSAASQWGINTNSSNYQQVDQAVIFNVPGRFALGQFVEDETTGGVYYGSGGTYHYVSTYSTFVNLGGSLKTILGVYPDFFTGLTQGSTYN